MDNEKTNEYYLNKIVADVEFMLNHTKGKSQKEIQDNPLLVDSIMFRLVQITENANKLTDDFKQQNKNIPWRAIKGMRNRIVHDYGEINLDIVYDTVVNSIPELYKALKG